MALSERLSILLETVGARTVVRDLDSVSHASRGLAGGVKQSTGALDGLAAKAGISGAALRGGLAVGAVAAGAGLVKLGADSVTAFAGLGASVLAFQRASGATAEQSSLLVAAFDDMGISAETGAKAVFKLGRQVAGGGGELSRFGVEVARSSDGTVDLAQTLLNVADAYTNTRDPAQRAALVQAAFGRSGRELIPILEKGRAGIEALYASARDTGQVLSQEEIRKAEEFRLAMDGLKDAAREFQLTIGSALIPSMTILGEVMAGLIEKSNDLGESLGSAFRTAWDWASEALGPVSDLLGFFGAFDYDDPLITRGIVDDSVIPDLQGVEEGIAGVTQQSGILEAGLTDLMGTLMATSSVQQSYDSALQGVADAQDSLSTAQSALNGLLARGAVDTAAVAAAQEEVESTSRALAQAEESRAAALRSVNEAEKELSDLLSGRAAIEAAEAAGDDLTAAVIRKDRATLDLTKAEKRLADLRNPQAGTAEEISDAERGLARAEERLAELQSSGEASALDLADAQDAVSDASRDLTRLRTPQKASAEEIAAAELDVRQAELDLKTATDGVTQATKDLSAAQKIGAENSPEVIEARGNIEDADKTLKTATDGVTTATKDLTDATDDLVAAQAGDTVKYNNDLAGARKNVAKEERGLKTARFNLAEQSYRLADAQQKEADALVEAGPAAQKLREELEKMLALRPELGPFLQPILDSMGELAKAGVQIPLLGGLTGAGAVPFDPRLGIGGIIPGGAEGAFVRHSSGGTIMRVGEGRFDEAVVPLRPGMGTGGTTVIVNVSGTVVSERRLVDAVAEGLRSRQRRSGSLGLN